MDIDKYPYDRNEKCKAYIPYGEGKRYYQATFYGARTEEMLLFSDWSKEAIESDLGNGIVARFHDESYLNRYLLKSYPRVVNEQYRYSNYMHYPVAYKAVLLDKDEYLGIDMVRTKQVGVALHQYADVVLRYQPQRELW